MFTDQAVNLSAALRQTGFSDQQVSALMNFLGNCQQALDHRGPVALGAPDPAPIGTPGITQGYALDIPPGSSINNQGDQYVGGDTNLAGPTLISGDTTISGDTISIGGPSSTTTANGTWDFTGATVLGITAASDHKVAVNASGTGGYLEDRLRDNHVEASAQYNATQDFLIESDTVDVTGEKLSRFFLDSSDLTNFTSSATVRRAIGIASGASAVLKQGFSWSNDPGTNIGATTVIIGLQDNLSQGVTFSNVNKEATLPNYGNWLLVYRGAFYLDTAGGFAYGDNIGVKFIDHSSADLGDGTVVTVFDNAGTPRAKSNVTLCAIVAGNQTVRVQATSAVANTKTLSGSLTITEIFS